MSCPYGCVLLAFRVIDPGLLRVLATAIDSANVQLSAMQTTLEAKAAIMDVLLAPAQAKYNALQSIIDEQRQKLNVVPAEYIAVCPELGILQQYLQKVIDQLLGQIDTQFRELRDMLDLKLKLQYELGMVAQLKNFLQDVRNCIGQALAADGVF